MINVTNNSSSVTYYDGEPIAIKFCKLDGNAKTPIFLPNENGGIDLYPVEEIKSDNPYVTVPTGLAFELPAGVHAMVVGRSGNAFKRKVIPFYGLIDNSYRGEIQVMLLNYESFRTPKTLEIVKHVAVAQLVLIPYAPINLLNSYLVEVSPEELSKTSRENKGFGSTGHI